MTFAKPSALAAGAAALLTLPAAQAKEPVQVLASFSVLADMVEQIGGDHVEVTSLVGADSDAHVFTPRPTDARALAEADLVVLNGLQFEGWMSRLVEASDYAGPTVVATDGIEQALGEAAHADEVEHGHDDGHKEHGHDEHDHDEPGHDDHGHAGHAHAHEGMNPHTWLDLGLGELYVNNIRDGLIAVDPSHEADYRERAADYQQRIDALDAEVHALMDELPKHTAVITGHQSFNHFSRAYGVDFLSPAGLSTEAEPSAARMAELIEVINHQGVQALFQENMTSPAIIEQLAEETGLPIAGTLYSGALAAEGEASTWLGMMRHNAWLLHDALATEDAAHEHADHDH
ncbi:MULTISPECIES: metal ABC transporter solute-binding protein, Zn/Mn family [Halomonas]|uniref:Metal ABC transporter substrate-binding protein n=1 Tax=Halomonas halophila TaxID=29573 RepID=A0ABQ0U4P6_9GAMM|nr:MULTISPECIES: zinc ABC transporter substrate-binding protein [Halomonas]MDR5888955.1 zinc ABC transporter substrate-binding protein [Halomonas salina]WJY07481.1 zinc ABC transporter substrate-binding protein [Halomonas halophila]GEK73413.1 metal ABC transporter substrate-binding protein [Halomonas halophila]